MYKYKTKSGQPAFIPGIGQTAEDGTITLSGAIEAPGLELVNEEQTPAAPSEQPVSTDTTEVQG